MNTFEIWVQGEALACARDVLDAMATSKVLVTKQNARGVVVFRGDGAKIAETKRVR